MRQLTKCTCNIFKGFLRPKFAKLKPTVYFLQSFIFKLQYGPTYVIYFFCSIM